MKIYLAATEGSCIKDNFNNFYRLSSFEYIKKEKDFTPNIFKDFILDSGAFTFLNTKKKSKIDWDEYMSQYAAFIIKYQIKNYIEIDIDSIIGINQTEALRRRLEKKVGWQSMPVWHVSRGYDKWLEICRDYNYICIGGFVTGEIKKEKLQLIPKFLQDAKRNDCLVHGLGFTRFDWMKRLRFHSVDSSTWSVSARYGEINQFKVKDRQGYVHRTQRNRSNEETRIKNRQELLIHNFSEWVKYSEWAEEFI